MSDRRGYRGAVVEALPIAAAVVVVFLLCASPAAARLRINPGSLDPTFGDGGRAASALPGQPTVEGALEPGPWSLLWEEHVGPLASGWNFSPPATAPQTALATGSDGSVVVAMGNEIFRYRPDGAIDRSWGDGGELAVDQVEGLAFRLSDVAVDPEGRVLAFGSAVDPSYTIQIPEYWQPFTTHPSVAVAMRFDSSGALDPTYGGGDGVFRGDFGTRPPEWARACRQPSGPCPVEGTGPSNLPLVGVRSGTLDSAGRAVMTLQQVGPNPAEFRGRSAWLVHAVARLTPDGALDASFGGGGVTDLAAARTGNLSEPAIDLRGEVLLAREQVPSPVEEYRGPLMGEVLRLQPGGAFDPTFGTLGAAHAVGGADAIATDREGRVIMLQPPSHPKARPGVTRQGLARLTAEGNADRSFGRRGRIWATLPGRYSEISSLRIDGRGRVLLAGTVAAANGQEHLKSRTYFTVIRLLPSGKPDRSFGHGGWIRTGFGRRTVVRAEGMALLPQGRLLVAGYGRSPELQPAGVVAARYRLGR
jgi:uncharacterized delta-60 repeat protein